MYTRLSAPLDVQWELTWWCTNNCAHCYNYWRRGQRPRRKLTVKQRAILKKSANEMIANKVFHLTLTGGEPLGVIKQIMPILRSLKEAGIRMSINTNLMLFNNELVQMLRELDIRSVLTSLMSSDELIHDGLAQTKGAYKRTIKGIKLAVSSGFMVSVNMVVSQKNFHTIYETGKLASELGCVNFCASKVTKPSNCDDFSAYALSPKQAGEMFQTLLRVKHGLSINVDSLEPYPLCMFPDSTTRVAFGARSCSAGKTSCTIGFDGSIRPCSHTPVPYGFTPVIGLKLAWAHMDDWRDDSLVTAGCRGQCCAYNGRCGGECRMEALDIRPTMDTEFADECVPAKIELLPMESATRLCPQVSFREEKFGHIAYRSSKNWLAIDPTLYELLTATTNGSVLTVAVIADAYKASETDALETLSLLKAKRIVALV